MATRLSKLQKWILCETHKRAVTDMLFQWEIIQQYYGYRNASREAAVSRSVWSLIDSSYAQGISPITVSNMALVYGMQGKSFEEFKERYGKFKPNEKLAGFAVKGFGKAKAVILTDKGKEKAKQLVSVK